MKTPSHQLQAQGGILAVAMIMVMLGGLFMAGWISLASMRASYARNSETAARRRLMLENSKAYTQQMARQNTMNGNSTMGPVVSILSDGSSNWGGLDTAGGWSGLNVYALPNGMSYPLTGYSTTSHPYNFSGMRPGPSYVSAQKVQRPTAYYDVIDPFSAYLFLKAINPCLSGDGLVVYRKPATESGEIELASNLYVNGRLVVRDPSVFFNSANINLGAKFKIGTLCNSLYLQHYDPLNRVTGTDSTGEVPCSNLAAVPSTYGPFPSTGALSTSDLYRGELNIIQNSANPSNSLWDIQQRESDAGHNAVQTISVGTAFGVDTDPVYIRDETNPPYPPPAWPSGYPHVWKVLYINVDHPNLNNLRIYGVVQQIVFLGQKTSSDYNAASTMSPISVIVLPDALTRTVQDFAFERENSRPLIIAAKGTHRERLDLFWTGHTTPSVATPMTMDWRMIFINEYRQVTVYPPNLSGVNSVSITGGFLTNWSVKRLDTGAASTFTITPDWSGNYNLASVLPRDAWLESEFLLTAP